MVFTTERFCEVALESQPEWNLNPRPLNLLRRSNRLTYHAMSSTRTQRQIFTPIQISSFVQCQISFGLFALLSRHNPSSSHECIKIS